MPPSPHRHRAVILAIDVLCDRSFSGRMVARLAGVPHTSAVRVMGVLMEMGLLTYQGSGGPVPQWVTTMSWLRGEVDLMTEQYACWIIGRRLAKTKS